MSAPEDLVVHLARFGGALRARGARVSLSDEADGLAALTLVDLGDRDEVRRALLAALKIRPRDREAFEELFARLWRAHPGPPGGATEERRRSPAPGPAARPVSAASLPAAPTLHPAPSMSGRQGGPDGPRPESRRPAGRSAGALAAPPAASGPAGQAPGDGEPGYSREALLRRKPFEECSEADLAAMEHLMERLALRLAARPGRRRVPSRGRGEVDLRRSFRAAVAQGGEFRALARRERAIERIRLVVLCDTSGSMDPYARFVLALLLAQRRLLRAGRGCEIFAFNTALVRITPLLRARGGGGAAPGGAAGHPVAATLGRLAASVPDWSGGTRIGECLAEFAAHHLAELVDGRTVVMVLSDGLDRGDVLPLAGAMRAIRARARRVLWLNPLAGDRRYEPTARAMAAALPYVDHLLPAHDLESLERALALLPAG